MPDIEKVIEELTEIHDEAYDRWSRRPYVEDELLSLIKATSDALALLWEREPVGPEPVVPINENYWKHTMGRCGHCEAPLPALEGLKSKFCWMCGRKVKWDD